MREAKTVFIFCSFLSFYQERFTLFCVGSCRIITRPEPLKISDPLPSGFRSLISEALFSSLTPLTVFHHSRDTGLNHL
jgi:hypothetical protein